MTPRPRKTWPWFVLAAALVALGLFVVAGSAGTILLAVGLLALFGAGMRAAFGRAAEPPYLEDRRLPAGHSGM
jgi:hypothetical protein